MKSLILGLIFLLNTVGYSQPDWFHDKTVRVHSNNSALGYVILEWDNNEGAGTYEVFVDDALNQSVSAYEATVQGLTVGQSYKFEVRKSGGSFAPAIYVVPNLYPDQKQFTTTSYSYVAEPNNNNWYINQMGVSERAVTDRSVEGDNSSLTKDYAPMNQIHRNAAGDDVSINIGYGSNRERYSTVTYTKLSSQLVERHVSTEESNDVISYWASGNKLYRNTNGTRTLIYTASGYLNNTSNLIQDANGMMSSDGKYIALIGFKTATGGGRDSQGDAWCIVFNLDTDSVVSEINSGEDIDEGFVCMSPSGDYVIWKVNQNGPGNTKKLMVRNNDATQSEVFTIYENGQAPGGEEEYLSSGGHGTPAVTLQGNDCWAMRDAGKIAMVVFSGPKSGLVMNLTPTDSPEISHASFAHDNWGWANFDNDWTFDNPNSNSLLHYRKIITIKLDEYFSEREIDQGGDSNVREWARTMWKGTKTSGQVSGNARDPMGTPNAKGTQVYFNNYFGTDDVDLSHTYAETYVAQQIVLHGDEIPYTGGGGEPAQIIKRKNANSIIN